MPRADVDSRATAITLEEPVMFLHASKGLMARVAVVHEWSGKA